MFVPFILPTFPFSVYSPPHFPLCLYRTTSFNMHLASVSEYYKEQPCGTSLYCLQNCYGGHYGAHCHHIKILLTNSSSKSGIGKFASVDELVCFLFLENDSPVIHHIVSLLWLLGNYALRLGPVISVSLRQDFLPVFFL